MLKPKQAKAGQDDLTICMQLIQPPGGAISHTSPEPKQVWAELDSPVGAAGVQTDRCPSSFLGCFYFMMWGAR